MSATESTSVTAEQGEPRPRLRANATGWIGAAALGAIIMSPAGGIYFNFGPMVQKAGAVAAFIFILAMIASLPTALSFAVVASEMPSAGSVYTWLWNATRPSIGMFIGWIFAGFYVLAMIVLPGIFALFFNEFLSYFGIATGFGTWVIGILVTTGVVIAFDFFGVKITIRGTEIFMLAESIILFALAITILAVGGFHHHLTAVPFNPGTAIGGSSAVFGALIFGIQANVLEHLYRTAGGARLVWGSDMPNVERHCTYRQARTYLEHYADFIGSADRERIQRSGFTGALILHGLAEEDVATCLAFVRAAAPEGL